MPTTIKLLLSLLLLTGCSAQSMKGDGSIQPDPVQFELLPPAEIATPLLLQQAVTLIYGEGQQRFLVVARFERERLRLSILTPGGQTLLSLDYDGLELREDSRVEIDLRGRELLSIMQFGYWPEASLRRHYTEDEAWQLSLGPGQRQLLTESGRALTIAIQPGGLQVDNHISGYRVIVETLVKTEL